MYIFKCTFINKYIISMHSMNQLWSLPNPGQMAYPEINLSSTHLVALPIKAIIMETHSKDTTPA